MILWLVNKYVYFVRRFTFTPTMSIFGKMETGDFFFFFFFEKKKNHISKN